MTNREHSIKLRTEEQVNNYVDRLKNSNESRLKNEQELYLEKHRKKLGLVTDISQKKADIQLAWIEKQNTIRTTDVCILVTNNDKVKEAYNKMIRNEFKTIG